MPKIHNTRLQRARELMNRIETGPALPRGKRMTRADYQLWFDSWVKHELIDLIPELRSAEREKKKR